MSSWLHRRRGAKGRLRASPERLRAALGGAVLAAALAAGAPAQASEPAGAEAPFSSQGTDAADAGVRPNATGGLPGPLPVDAEVAVDAGSWVAPLFVESRTSNTPLALSTEELEQMSLEELLSVRVTTATKSERPIEQAPSIVTVFRRDDIERLQARLLIDLLRFVPGFFEVASHADRNVAIRGIHATGPQHFLVLVNGQAMNDLLTSGASPDAYVLDYAERVEIVRGPASTMYGASALMGVVNIITRPGTESQPARLRASYGGDNTVHVSGAASEELGGGRRVHLSGSVWASDGSRRSVAPGEDVLWPTQGQNLSDGIQPGENLTNPLAGGAVRVNGTRPSFDLFLRAAPRPDVDLQINLARVETSPQRTYRQSLLDPRSAIELPRRTTQRLLVDLAVSRGSVESLGRLTLRPALLLFQNSFGSQGIATAFFDRAAREGESLSYGYSGVDVRVRLDADYQIKLRDWSAFSENVLQAGLQGEFDVAMGYNASRCYLDTSGQRRSPSPYAAVGAPDVSCTMELLFQQGLVVDAYGRVTASGARAIGNGSEVRAGAFAQFSTLLWKRVVLVGGGRVDVHGRFGPSVSPRVSLVAPIFGGLYAKVQLARAFVYPPLLYTTTNALSEYEGQTSIKPQAGDAAEALVGYRYGPLRIEANVYHHLMSDFITFNLARNAQTGRFVVSNQGDLNVVGLELALFASLLDGRLTLNVGGSYGRAIKASTAPLFLVDGSLGGPSKSPQWLGSAIVSYSPLRGLVATAALRANSSVPWQLAPQTRFSGMEATDGRPASSLEPGALRTSATVVDLGLQYALRDRWRFGLKLTNVADDAARLPGAVLVPYATEGRRLMGTLGYDFN